VISMIQIASTEKLSRNGMTTVQMKVSELYPPQDIPLIPGETVMITYHDFGEGYTTAWHNYFSDPQVFTQTPSLPNHPNACSVSGSTLTIPDVTKIVIKTYKIDILNL
jgi:hypothetical protein